MFVVRWAVVGTIDVFSCEEREHSPISAAAKSEAGQGDWEEGCMLLEPDNAVRPVMSPRSWGCWGQAVTHKAAGVEPLARMRSKRPMCSSTAQGEGWE